MPSDTHTASTVTDTRIQIGAILFLVAFGLLTLWGIHNPAPWSPVGQYQQQQINDQHGRMGDLRERARDFGYAPADCPTCRGT